MTRLYNWYITEDEFDGRKVRRIQGIITGDEKYRDSTPVRTAGICSIVKDYKQDQLIVTTEEGRAFFCFVGVNDQPENIWDTTGVILDSSKQFPYRASCIVSLSGNIVFKECVVPNTERVNIR